MKEIIKRYIDKIDVIYSTGNATEHSYRGEFKQLCEECLNINHKKGKKGLYTLVNEPKRKAYGAPDYELLKDDVSIAFIEAKQIGDPDLRGENVKRNKKQFDRYKDAISTIAFTDYLNIILYENGEESLASSIGRIEHGKIVFNDDIDQVESFAKIITILGNATPRPIRSSTILAERMANKAKLIATILQNAMEIEESDRSAEDKELWGKLKTFQKYLVHDMTTGQFVDFYAQTILYGLFIARINDKTPETFSLIEASDLIPNINPFLRKIFKDMALANLHPMIKGVVEDLVLLFKATDMGKVLRMYKKDPLVHFYEDFLAAYNPKIREDFGVWYTPIQVVSFMVDATDHILKSHLNIESGLADNSYVENGQWHKVQILDPATGTGTFLSVIADKIYENYKGQEGLWGHDVAHHIIPRMNGFEYLIAPYTMAHLKLATALKLETISGKLPERLNIFLTNSLDEEYPESTFNFARYITDESNAASIIKRDTPVMVVIGNPPYNEKSSNKGKWIMGLMDDYKQEPGRELKTTQTNKGKKIRKNTLQETNAKGINNDYCKFIRLGHNFVKKTEEGVMTYICGNTFTKTNIFRGMRFELLKDFDDIYIINLHGSSKFDESTENVKDENIFDIMVGVSINIFVKRKGSSRGTLAKVHYKDVYGTRKDKLEYLASTKNVNPRGGAYLFPLYSYDDNIDKVFGNKVLNFNLDIIEFIEEKTGLRMQNAEDTERKDGGFLGVDVMDYIYAVLHSRKYRKRYHQLLQNNFPVIPYPKDAEYFMKMVQSGRQLRESHLLKGISQSDFITQYPVAEGSDIVTKRVFEADENGLGKVWINDTKYFDNVPKETWDLVISGYQPLDKWLKDRSNKALTGDEIRHFQKIVVALSRTSKLMEEIDQEIEFTRSLYQDAT
ncbi:MAG: N-6 DNA methylase [Muribaculum sp.]|nr:N-6 DNA methylase [Muribaculum sp.]